jgi:hypothetical protein
MTEQNKQPPAEAGEGAVYQRRRVNESPGTWEEVLPITYEQNYEGYEHRILYTSQTTATKAAVAAAKLECGGICDEVTSFKMAEWSSPQARPLTPAEIKDRILSSIPADHMQALRELIEEAVSKGFDIGLRYQGCLENNAADADIAIEVDRILAEKGKG